MYQSISKNRFSLNSKVPIIFLSVMSLLFYILSCADYFFYYYYTYDEYANNGYYSLSFRFLDKRDIFELILYILPSVVLVLYVSFLHKYKGASFMMPLVFFFTLLQPIYGIVFNGYRIREPYYLLWTILLPVAASVTGLIAALYGFAKKPLLITSAILGFFQVILPLYIFIQNLRLYDIEYGLYLYIITGIFDIVYLVFFYLAILFLGLKNCVPALINPQKTGINGYVGGYNGGYNGGYSGGINAGYNPEQALAMLKEKRDLGIISEQEYMIERSNIINRL